MRISEEGYRTITELLLSRGYQKGKQPFIFLRTVEAGAQKIIVEVDFLAGEYEGTGPSHRTQTVQDIRARKARGCDLAFRDPVAVQVTGALPGGGQITAEVKVAGIVPFLIMKAQAMKTRLKEKDSWDVDYCLAHYPGGIEALAKAFGPLRNQGLVREGLAILGHQFQAVDSLGPTHVADFEAVVEEEERLIRKRTAYERVQALLRALGVSRTKS
jgi:hypothetical protein